MNRAKAKARPGIAWGSIAITSIVLRSRTRVRITTHEIMKLKNNTNKDTLTINTIVLRMTRAPPRLSSKSL